MCDFFNLGDGILFCVCCLILTETIHYSSSVGPNQSDQDYCQSNVILLKASG